MFTSLPTTLANLTGLSFLHIHSNRISGDDSYISLAGSSDQSSCRQQGKCKFVADCKIPAWVASLYIVPYLIAHTVIISLSQVATPQTQKNRSSARTVICAAIPPKSASFLLKRRTRLPEWLLPVYSSRPLLGS